jgi:tRNA G37 N-methylase TrmD
MTEAGELSTMVRQGPDELQWQQITALLVWKLAPSGVTITTEDMLAFINDGQLLMAHGHSDRFDLRMVTKEEAQELSRS